VTPYQPVVAMEAAHAAASLTTGAAQEAAAAVANIEEWRVSQAPRPQPHARLSDGITVCLRKRPLSEREAAHVGTADERDHHEFDAVSVSNPSVFFHELEYGDKCVSRLTRTGGVAGRKYDFHHSFSEHDDNEEIYQTVVGDLVPFVIKGGVATCVAYGQTGAGKTHTQVAMQDMLARDLLASAQSKVKQGRWPDNAASLEFSFFENQGERCFDLQNSRAQLVSASQSPAVSALRDD
jgi:kinesin family protein 2/24